MGTARPPDGRGYVRCVTHRRGNFMYRFRIRLYRRRGLARVGTSMPRCDHCEAHVSDRFARVFADERGDIHACPNCSANAGIAEVSRERAHETRST
jgi:hypothetical protein